MSYPLAILKGFAAPLALANVDTDKILPSRFLKTVSRDGLRQALFHDLRYESARKLKDFILNRAPWDEAVFLIAFDNFGCGASREHAPWALLDFGIRCLIAPSFADIFANNCLKNGILPLALDRVICERLIVLALDPVISKLQLDLRRQVLITAEGNEIGFATAPEHRRRLLNGLDGVQETLCYGNAIAAHDARANYPRPRIIIRHNNLLAPSKLQFERTGRR